MKLSRKTQKVMQERMHVTKTEFQWHGAWQAGEPVITIDGEVHNAKHIAKLMGIRIPKSTKYGIEHADMARQDQTGDPAESGDGTGESQE